MSIAAGLVVARVSAQAAPQDVGKWSSPIDVGVVGIHAVLLHTGQVLLWQGPEDDRGSSARLFDPVNGTTRDVTIPTQRDIFCAASTVLSDGRVLVAGGMKYGTSAGSANLTLFDPETRAWSTGPAMAKARYYPTTVGLADGRTLVFNGSPQGTGLAAHPEMEVFDPVSGQWSTLPRSADSDSTLYSRAFVMPDGRVFRAGPQAETAVFDPVSNTWEALGTMNFGDRPGEAAVLLPDSHSVLVAGGSFRATATAEVIDLSADQPRWRSTGSMKQRRSEFNLVLLPDARVLAVGGGRIGGLYQLPVKEAEVYDPATGRWRLLAAQRVQRTYHSTALLLPDGRVLSAGSDFGLKQETVEIYSPPYLFRGARPVITSAPQTASYGQTFSIGTPDAARVSRVALIRPGSATHAVDFDQRYVDVDFDASSGLIEATAPDDAASAPPGYYMLFLIDADGVPSVARFIRLG
jgi:hypothetical protein